MPEDPQGQLTESWNDPTFQWGLRVGAGFLVIVILGLIVVALLKKTKVPLAT